MIASIPTINSSFCLTDESDPRYQYIASMKARFGAFLHDASASMLRHGEENIVDAVHMLIRSMRTYLMDYGDSRDK
jgi:proteasome activator subunit 4